jgi:hypothetical protein
VRFIPRRDKSGERYFFSNPYSSLFAQLAVLLPLLGKKLGQDGVMCCCDNISLVEKTVVFQSGDGGSGAFDEIYSRHGQSKKKSSQIGIRTKFPSLETFPSELRWIQLAKPFPSLTFSLLSCFHPNKS